MITCLHARNQENLLSGSREKSITDAGMAGMAGMAGINLYKNPKTPVRN